MAPGHPLEKFNMSALNKVQVELSYAKLFPLIAADFREIGDCCNIHKPGNMLIDGMAGVIPVTGAVTKYTMLSPLTESVRPGAYSKQGKYEASVAAGGGIIKGMTEGLLG